MTIKNTGHYVRIQHFYGKSTDTKPTTAEIGDKFTEIDTRDEFVFDGETWVSDNPTVHLRGISSSDNQKNQYTGLVVDTDLINSTFSEEYNTAQAGTIILTPTSGYKLCVRNVEIATDSNTGVVALDFATSGKKVGRLYATVQNRASSHTAHITGATDESLMLTTTTGTSNVFIVITYIEHL